MRNVKWLVAAGLLVSATGCMDLNGYPGTSMSGYPGGYSGYPSGYGQPGLASAGGLGMLGGLLGQMAQPSYAQPAPYYQPAPAYYQPPPAYYPPQQTQYVPVPVAQPRTQYVPVPTAGTRVSGGRDRNSNGVPDWRERDRNSDGVPDYQQRRRGPTG